jgi:hypothetical protein
MILRGEGPKVWCRCIMMVMGVNAHAKFLSNGSWDERKAKSVKLSSKSRQKYTVDYFYLITLHYTTYYLSTPPTPARMYSGPLISGLVPAHDMAPSSDISSKPEQESGGDGETSQN